ncbi:MAG: TonB family protein [Myxococcota bacterium]|nr:TonB family protein [Myxococcota bacterium]
MNTRLAICALFSVGAHCALAAGLDAIPPRERAVPRPPIEISLIAAPLPPPPPPPPPPEPLPEPPPQQVHERPRTKVPRATRTAPTPVDTPNTDDVPTTTATTTTPVYGVQMSSSSSSGPAVAQGNTTRVAPSTGAPGPARPLAAAAAAVEVTKMPIPLGRCSGKYTEAAKTAGIEGTVVLDLIVDETGRAREILVKEPLSHGLTEAAVAALRSCTFTPGERSGTPVAVRVRSFKIRFWLQDA